MRAWQVHAQGEPAEVLRLAEVETPEPGPGQARIRVAAAGIGLPDVLMCRGTYPLTPPLPFTCGQEAAGTVTAVGDGVELGVGDRIMSTAVFTEGRGSFAEECLVFADSAFPIPAGLTDAEAAGFWIPHLTAWVGLVDRGGIAAGDRVVVLGASGGSGIAAVQLAHALGAEVLAVVSDAERAAFCRQLGADETVVHGDGPIAPVLRSWTGGAGVDLLYDPVGGSLAEDAWAALTRDGRLLAIGFASGRWPEIPTHNFVITNTSLVGVIAGGQSRAELDEIYRGLASLVDDGSLRNAVTTEHRFDDLPEALQQVAERRLVGKSVLVP